MSLLEHPKARVLLADAEISAADVRSCQGRLQRFLSRYLPRFYREEQRELAAVVWPTRQSRQLSSGRVFGLRNGVRLCPVGPPALSAPQLGAGSPTAAGNPRTSGGDVSGDLAHRSGADRSFYIGSAVRLG